MDYHFFPNILFKRFIASENSRLWFEGCLKMISSWEAWEKVWESSEVSKLTSWFILWEVLHWKLFFICYTRWSCTSVSDVSLLISLFAGRKSCQNHRWKTGSWILRDVTCSRKWLPFLYRWSWQRERGRKKSVQCTKSFRQTTFENAWREEQREEFLWKIPSETIVLRTSDDRLWLSDFVKAKLSEAVRGRFYGSYGKTFTWLATLIM